MKKIVFGLFLTVGICANAFANEKTKDEKTLKKEMKEEKKLANMECITYKLFDACGAFTGYDTVCWGGNLAIH